jgi:hypothetical protein
MRHDIPDMPHMSEQYPHLIFHNITSNLGKRVRSIYSKDDFDLFFVLIPGDQHIKAHVPGAEKGLQPSGHFRK